MRTAFDVEARDLFPIQFRQKADHRLAFHARLQADQARDGLIEVNDAPPLIRHQHAVLDRVEQRLQQTALACEPLDDRLQPFRVQPPDAAKDFVEKTGFGCSHWIKSMFKSGKMAQYTDSSNQTLERTWHNQFVATTMV